MFRLESLSHIAKFVVHPLEGVVKQQLVTLFGLIAAYFGSKAGGAVKKGISIIFDIGFLRSPAKRAWPMQ